MENTQQKMTDLILTMETWGMFDNVSVHEKLRIMHDLEAIITQCKLDTMEVIKTNLFK
jgi:hypothetical protein